MSAYELLLPLGASGFYLLDSTMLLYSNEMLLQCGERWSFAAGFNFFLAGRRLWMPNPFAPQHALFRVAWSESDRRATKESPAQLAMFIAALGPLRMLVVVMLVLLIVGLPLSALIFGAGSAMLGVIAAYYLTVLLALALIYVRRAPLGLTRRDLWATAFDALACPPFAVNLLRKLCLRRSIAGNPLAFARDALAQADFARLQTLICARVEGEMQGATENSPRWHSLQAFRAYLENLNQPQPQADPAQELTPCPLTK